MYSVIPRPSPNYGTTEQISKYDSGSQMEWRELLGVKATRRKRDKGNNTADKSKSTAKHRGGTRTDSGSNVSKVGFKTFPGEVPHAFW